MGSICNKDQQQTSTRDVDLSDSSGNDEHLDDQYEFKSVNDLVPGCILFGDTSPNDLQQGALGDCWLLSAFAGIAEYPEFVENLITDNADGTFQVHLYSYEDQDFTTIGVNDCFPALGPGYSKPFAYCHVSKEKEFWPCVLEKAIAKMAGGYAEIEGGFSSWAFGMLTGCTDLESITLEDGSATVNEYCDPPSSNTPHDWGGQYYVGDEIDADQLMDLLVDYDESKYLMCAGSHSGSDSEFSDEHIVQGHAYTILQAAKAPAGQEGVNLLKLRNPWGKEEWNGDWSDGDAMWTQYPEVAEELNYQEGEDGAFWMPIEDFLEQYHSIYVCKHSMQGGATQGGGGGGATKKAKAQHDEADDGYQYYDGGDYPFYWKAEEGYDPYEDGFWWYWDGDSEADAEWYSYE